MIGGDVSEDDSHVSRKEQEECKSLHLVGIFFGQ